MRTASNSQVVLFVSALSCLFVMVQDCHVASHYPPPRVQAGDNTQNALAQNFFSYCMDATTSTPGWWGPEVQSYIGSQSFVHASTVCANGTINDNDACWTKEVETYMGSKLTIKRDFYYAMQCIDLYISLTRNKEPRNRANNRMRPRVRCNPVHKDFTNGDVSCTAGSFNGSVCSFKCHDGFDLRGSNVSVCAGDGDSRYGAWTSEAPTCERIRCMPRHTVLTNGEVSCTDDIFYGSVCSFKCNEGFTVRGANVTTCKDDSNGDYFGLWTENAPTCQRSEPVLCRNHDDAWCNYYASRGCPGPIIANRICRKACRRCN